MWRVRATQNTASFQYNSPEVQVGDTEMKGESFTINFTEICADQRRVESAMWNRQGKEQELSDGWESWGPLTSIEKEQ